MGTEVEQNESKFAPRGATSFLFLLFIRWNDQPRTA
jgi:hypothetical protein